MGKLYLHIPLAPLQQGHGILDILVCDGGELLQCKLLVFGKLCDVYSGVGHGG